MLTVEMNIMRNTKMRNFHLYAYLNSVRGIDMHIVDQSRTLDSVIDTTKN